MNQSFFKTTFWTFLFFASIIISITACTKDGETKTNGGTKTDVKPPSNASVTIPSFNRDSAYAYIAKQVDFGPRVPNSPGHKACRSWLVNKFKSFGADVIEQNFDATAYTGTVLKSTNIIAQYNPGATKRMLLCAHWDTRHHADKDPDAAQQSKPILGADDGGSGVGVLVEIARVLQKHPVKNIGVDLILFDAEDHGDGGEGDNTLTWCLGSQHWSNNPHKAGYRAKYGILLDMVGSKNARFTKEEISMGYAGNIMNKVWKIAQSRGYTNLFVDEQTRGITDDHYFVNKNAKIPTIDIINRPVNSKYGFGDYWHTHDDDMDVISKKTLKSVGMTVLSVIYMDDAGRF